MKRNRKLVIIVALIAAAVYYLLPSVDFYSMTDDERETLGLKAPEQLVDLKKRSLNLGLDLQGGIHLVLEVKTEGMEQQEAQDAVAQAQEVIRNRIDQFGVAEPTIQRQGDNRIIIELPGVQDVQRAKDLVGQTALLEFQLLEPAEDRTRLIQRIDQVLAPKEEDTEEEEDLLLSSTPESAPLSSMLSPTGEDLTVSGRDLQRVKNLLNTSEAQELIPADVEFLFSSKPAGAEGNEFYFLYLVRKKPEMTGHMIQDAFVSIGQVVEYMGQPIVNFSTTDEGVRLFSRITGSHIGERMAIVLDESVYSAPVIQTKI
ncbi:MAG: hypothetical protein F4184_07605, partial [Gemmatimonadetes bacterium]|nr:hypothetical protein [Gemmatimonadota bacterium]